MVRTLRILLVFLVACLFVLPAHASAATLSLVPSSNTVTAGSIFTEQIVVSSDQALNAVSANLSFPPDLVEITSIVKAGSVLTLWVQDPSYSNTDGTATLSGIVPNPGWQGSGGTVATITLLALKPGSGTIGFVNSSVLANDGTGTNILTSAASAAFTITSSAAQAPSAKHRQNLSRPHQATVPATTTPTTTTTMSLVIPSTVPLSILGIVLLTLLIGLALGYIASRLVAARHLYSAQSLRKVHTVLHKHFGVLKDAVSEEIAELEKVRSQRNLTLEEERLNNRLTKILDEQQHEIERELFDK